MVPSSSRISPYHQDQLESPFTIEDITLQVSRLTKASCPGEDGLGYPFLAFILRHKLLQPLLSSVYNDALRLGVFPSSWQDLRVRLLPKKGLLSDLKNWRPISLINCDAKVFTRLLTRRMAPAMSTCINRYQTGFLPGRFIAENGLTLKILMEQANVQGLQHVGMLLDQEKAYDRVHPSYMKQTLLRFGFPAGLTSSICNLFFGNRVHINFNGYFTDAVDQQRGLRQGDPLSPLLFNLAMEPLLLSLLHDDNLIGFPPSTQPVSPTMPRPMKLLAYADDLCIFLSNQQDFHRAMAHLTAYNQASNAKVNVSKTEVFSLSGARLPTWITFFRHQGINQWHDASSPTALRYLGFPLAQSSQQTDATSKGLLDKIRIACNIYSQRQISIRGRVTIANTLILSRLWYILRVVHLPVSFFASLRSTIYQFVTKGMNPSLRYLNLCLPLTQGGLGLLHGYTQSLILQYRWLAMVFSANGSPNFCSSWLRYHLSSVSGSLASYRLPFLCSSL